jgi:hypothetical protein
VRGWRVEVPKHRDRQLWRYGLEERPKGLQVIPRRWVIERTFAWLSRDYERLPGTGVAMIHRRHKPPHAPPRRRVSGRPGADADFADGQLGVAGQSQSRDRAGEDVLEEKGRCIPIGARPQKL